MSFPSRNASVLKIAECVPPDQQPSDIDFRAAMRHLPGGVSVITTGRGDERTGFTATSASSLSVDPPTMLVSVNRGSSSYQVLTRSSVFGVNVLGSDQSEIASKFSGAGGARGAERYKEGRWFTLTTGVSLLSEALASFDCEVEEIIERHTHAVVIGRVKAMAVSDGSSALIYWRGGFDHIGWSRDEVSRVFGLSPVR